MSLNQIKLSVIVPVYNAESYLAKCIEHIIHQTYTNLELILVDDGSTDNSPAIYNSYAARDPRIRIFTQKNSGPANAQNNGMQYITGEYVHIMDNDDWLELDYYEKMLDAAKQTGADITCCEVEEYGFEFPRFPQIQILTSVEEKILVTGANHIHPAWRYIYKTEFLDKHNLRFPRDMFHSQDTIFSVTALVLAQSVATVPGAVYHCLNRPTSLSKGGAKLANMNGNNPAAQAEFEDFKKQHGIAKYFTNSDEYNLPLETVKFTLFGLPIWKQKIWQKKTKYYLFGLDIARKKTV